MGVNADYKSKARDDYNKRTDDPLGENQAETTFVFVTPHRWADKEKWEREQKEAGPWKAVRVLDIDNLMQGLEEARAVHVRLSEILGKPATAVRSIEDWWQRFCAERRRRFPLRSPWQVGRTAPRSYCHCLRRAARSRRSGPGASTTSSVSWPPRC